jgi:hypothetical protein
MTPYDIILPAGKTCVLVDANTVQIVKDAPADKSIRIFTSWESHVYDTNAAALADITAKGWKHTPAIPTAPTIPAASSIKK